MKYLIANFKQNGDKQFYKNYAQHLKAHFVPKQKCRAIFCVPATYLQFVKDNLKGLGVLTGSQTVSQHPGGAFTGCISASMIADCGASYTIVNHSEHHFANSKKIADKIKCCKAAGVSVIYCIGKNNKQDAFANDDGWISAAIDALPADICAFDVIIAYEPTFAIGTGKQPTSKQIDSVVRKIKQAVKQKLGLDLPVVYGGSVTPENCKQIAECDIIDGFMVGGACLDPENLVEIYNHLASAD